MHPVQHQLTAIHLTGANADAIDLVEPGFIKFDPDGTGQFGFIAVHGWMDCRESTRDGPARVEFTWEGSDEGDQVGGRDWATLADDGTIDGHIFFHLGDDSAFRGVPEPAVKRSTRTHTPMAAGE